MTDNAPVQPPDSGRQQTTLRGTNPDRDSKPEKDSKEFQTQGEGESQPLKDKDGIVQTQNGSPRTMGESTSQSQQRRQIDPTKIESNPRFYSTVDKANPLSRLFFFYGFPVGWKSAIRKLTKKDPTLQESDLPTIPWKKRADVVADRISYYMQERLRRKPEKKLNLTLAVFKAIKWTLFWNTFIECVFVFVRLFSTWVIKRLIETYTDPDASSGEAYGWAGVLTGCLVVGFFAEHHWNFTATYYPVVVQNALITLIFSKITRLSSYSLTQISSGRIINLTANNLNFLDAFGMFFTSVLVAPLAALVGGVIIWQSFGVFTLISIGYVVAWWPVQIFSIFASTKSRAETTNLTNERVKTTSETIEGIRLLKMYTWEMKFKEKIENIRKKEIKFLKGATIGSAIGRACAFSVQDCGSFLMFIAWYYTDHTLNTADVFSAYFTLGYLRIFSSYFTAAAFMFVEEAHSNFKAIEKILRAPEIGSKAFEKPQDNQNSVEFENFSAYWETDDPKDAPESFESDKTKEKMVKKDLVPSIRDVNLKIKKGSVNALVGGVGSSKTSFLMTFTGEMPKTTGSLRYNGNIAYVEQEPTIFAGTFRENVLFGKPFDEERYKQAVKACNLQSDLKLFAKGDEADIVGGGNNLSGGQKARLAFARAVYANADIYLLDDPLSAVDPKVARSLYKNAIEGALKGKTIILVTHQVDFVKNCENIIVMEAGKVLGSGTLDELRENGVHPEKIFGDDDSKDQSDLSLSKAASIAEPELHRGPTSTKHMNRRESSHIDGENANGGNAAVVPTTSGQGQEGHRKIFKRGRKGKKGQRDHHVIETSPTNNDATDLNNEEEDKKIISGEMLSGRVGFKTYVNLVKEMGGWPAFIGIIAAVVASQMAIIAYGRILGAWIGGTFPAWKCAAILGGLVGFDILMFNIVFILVGVTTLRASRKYHEKMLNKVINAKVLFFDTNSVGQVVNRFSSDIGSMDRYIPLGVTDCLNIFGFLITILITVGIVSPVLLAPLLGAMCFAVFFILMSYPSIEQAKLYEIRSKGPAFSLLSETLNGSIIMRMYKQEENFKKKFREDIHRSTKGNFAFVLAARIGGFYSDLSYTLAVIGCIFISTAKSGGDDSAAYLAAFSLALLLGITGLLQYGLRQFATLNISMSSVARVQEFVNIPSEPPQEIQGDDEKRENGWPDKGKIEMDKVYMKYRPDGDFVIKDLNLEVEPGEKIGCVGRTGAGKSTIVQMLYRMREIDRKEKGSKDSFINVDDVNTQSVGLKLLRGNISMIPQTPYIFSETIRTNIDPLGLSTDDEIWDVLEDVRLKEHIAKQSDGLETKINGGSSIFSVGQKQLVCLARVVLKPAPVLIMDEATANMDHDTDNFLQQKIDQRFADSTRFTIAHRLTTIANYDKVLVLSKGRKVEFDEPYKLLVKDIGDEELTNKEGHFSVMVQNTGPISSKQIFEIAKNAYFDKHQTELGPRKPSTKHHHHHNPEKKNQ